MGGLLAADGSLEDGSRTHKWELERRQQIGFGNFIGKLSLTNLISQFVTSHWGLTVTAGNLVAHWLLEGGIATGNREDGREQAPGNLIG